MQLVRVPLWGLSLHRADYYGWLLCAHVGPWLAFVIYTQARP